MAIWSSKSNGIDASRTKLVNGLQKSKRGDFTIANGLSYPLYCTYVPIPLGQRKLGEDSISENSIPFLTINPDYGGLLLIVDVFRLCDFYDRTVWLRDKRVLPRIFLLSFAQVLLRVDGLLILGHNGNISRWSSLRGFRRIGRLVLSVVDVYGLLRPKMQNYSVGLLSGVMPCFGFLFLTAVNGSLR